MEREDQEEMGGGGADRAQEEREQLTLTANLRCGCCCFCGFFAAVGRILFVGNLRPVSGADEQHAHATRQQSK
jgi:hypothetical protein